jgi:hypothetical protein
VDETAADLARLQALLDSSYASAGPHLLGIHTPERRMTAEQIAARLTGMSLLTLATVTRDGRPITGPVDGIFHRGAFHFSSGADSLRFRHIARGGEDGGRAPVSATHLPGEELAVTVHGRAVPIELDAPEHAAFKACVLGIYLPRYGDDYLALLSSGARYMRIDPERMYAFSM